MKPNVIKIVSICLSVVGAGVSVAADYFADKKLDAKIAEKVAKAIESK